MSEEIGANNWLQLVCEELGKKQIESLPDLNFDETFFNQDHSQVTQDVSEILPQLTSVFETGLNFIQSNISIDGHSYKMRKTILKDEKIGEERIARINLKPQDSSLPIIKIRPNDIYKPKLEEMTISVITQDVCQSPQGATLARIEQYNYKGKPLSDVRRLELPLGTFQVPGFLYQEDDSLNISAHIDHDLGQGNEYSKKSRIGCFSVYIERNGYPNEVIRTMPLREENKFWPVVQRPITSMSKDPTQFGINLITKYGNQLLGKKLDMKKIKT